MTYLFGVRDPGRAGGSWLMHICNVHPAGMRVLGELHLSTELDFPYPCPTRDYDQRGIEFLGSQMRQGVAAAGIVKCFFQWSERLIREQGGRVIQLIRNPMEVVGFRTHHRAVHKPGVDRRFLGRAAQNRADWIRAHAIYYAQSYAGLLDNWQREPLVRIEDLNRSCGGDGLFLKGVMEYLTQTPFSVGYIRHIQQHYLPGYHYPCESIKHDGVVVGIKSEPRPYQEWRMSWADDPLPAQYWEQWSPAEREIFVGEIGPICDRTGYNHRGRPGSTDVAWPLRDKYAWGKEAVDAIPYVGGVAQERPKLGEAVPLPVYTEKGNADA